MPTPRTIEALRALAERTGTEAEGIIAREILGRLELRGELKSEEPYDWEAAIAARQEQWNKLSKDDLLEAIRRSVMEDRARPFPTVWRCDCGAVVPTKSKCENHAEHERVREEIPRRFKKGDRVYYNQHAYTPNDPGVVVGFVKPKLDNWQWIRIKFDRLKNAQAVPVRSAKGWRLSHHPILKDQSSPTETVK